jgi:hypothetical protein
MLQRTVVFTLLLLLAMPSMAAMMRKDFKDKTNIHPCKLKTCTKEEVKKYRKYSILYGQMGKEKKTPALRDRR